MHVVDVVIAGILAGLTNTQSSNLPNSAAAEVSTVLLQDIKKRRSDNSKACPNSSLFSQVGALLTPAYRNMKHMMHIGQYAIDNRTALFTVAEMATRMNPEAKGSTVQHSTNGGSRTGEKATIHPLLSTGVTGENAQGSHVDLETRVVDEYRFYELSKTGHAGDDVLAFWKQEEGRFPLLSRMARLVYTPTASSTASERVFSLAGLIRNKRRQRLNPELTEAIMKVSHNLRFN